MEHRLMSRVLVACIVTTVAVSVTADTGPFCTVAVSDNAPQLVRQAAQELSCFLGRISGGRVPIVRAPDDAPCITLSADAEGKSVADDGYSITGGRDDTAPRVEIKASTPLGVLHGAYRLLREYGVGFYFDGNAVPAREPETFLTPTIKASPVFKIRGSLPWYNFLNSPTTWDIQDFRFFADQIVRSGQNFIGFHTYDFEPFAAYEYEGELIGGEPLRTTEGAGWGTHPLPVDEFGFGSGRFFLGEYWGSDVARMSGGREERIIAQKRLLARGLAYASARGVKTCLGFEVGGDPTRLADQKRFRARLRQLLEDYPMLDYVWLWEPEGRAVRGTGPPALRSQAGRLYREWEYAFDSIDEPARKWEGMRVAYYGRLAQQTIDAVAPDVQVVLSGWGGDNWLHVSDFFPCWDKVLDKRIIFAALDNIRVSPTVSRYYDLPNDRERWAIPWYEYDGDQWFPQANAHIFTQTVRDARNKGCQGLLGIHWRTKAVGETQALVAQYAWDPGQTLADFYTDYGIRRLGQRWGERYGQLLMQLDELGYRWISGSGQSECGTFRWDYVDNAEREQELKQLRSELREIRDQLLRTRYPSGALGRISDTIATIDRVLAFNEIARYLVDDGPVDRALGMQRDDPDRAAKCEELLAKLIELPFGDMLNMYAETITSRGEMGVLATINTKAFVDYREKIRKLQEACDQAADRDALTAASTDHRCLISDYQLSSWPSDEPLVVRCVAYDGPNPASGVRLHYATSANSQWQALRMVHRQRSVFEAGIPKAELRPGWLRYRISASIGDGRVQWPQLRGEPYRQVTVFPGGDLIPRRNQLDMAPPALARGLRLQCEVRPPGTVRLSWHRGRGLPEAILMRRLGGERDSWETIGRTLDWAWEDGAAPSDADVEYRLQDAEGSAVSTRTFHVPPAPLPTRPYNLTVVPWASAVHLSWAGADISVASYHVQRAESPAGQWETVTPTGGLRPDTFGPNSYIDHPPISGTVFYRVSAEGRSGDRAAVSAPVPVEVSAKVPEPALNLDFEQENVESPTGPVSFTGPHSFQRVDGRGVLRTDGGLVIPYGPALAVDEQFTVAVRFRQREETPIPVLVSQGVWGGAGYFVQLLGRDLRFYVGGAGHLDCRVNIQPEQWHTVVCVYDGRSLFSYLDGRLLGAKRREAPMQPSSTHFTVARYDQVGNEWTFKGDVDFVRLYRQAVEPSMVLRDAPIANSEITLDWSDQSVNVGDSPGAWHQQPRIAATEHGPAADMKGGLTVPFSRWFGDRFVLETRFLLRDTAGMPVLVNQGLWPGEGYMLQVFDGRIRWHVGGVGSVDCGPGIQPDTWYAVRCVYDDGISEVFVNGEKTGEMKSKARMVPSLRPLRIGRYELSDEQYVVDGLIGRTRVYPLND